MGAGGRPFVGRARELEALERGLESALVGRGAVFVLAGEPGIGKTRLADELAARAGAKGATVLWGRCWETGPAPAYWPWTQVLRELPTARDPGLAPLLEGAVPTGLASTPEVESARFRLHDAAFRALKAASAAAPLVIILDDLHAADQDSLSLLLFVARNARTLKLLLVCTTREAEVATRPALESQLMRVGREGTRLPLARLSQQDVAQLVRQLCAAPVSEDAIAAVFRSTDGTPLFVDEAVRLLEARGLDAVRTLSTDVTARDVLQAHLSLLPTQAHAVLQAAAVIGREFSLKVLAEVVAGTATRPPASLSANGDAGTSTPPAAALSANGMAANGGATSATAIAATATAATAIAATATAATATAIAAAEKARIIIASAPGGRYRFAHVLLQQALYESLEPAARARLHEAIARTLESHPAEAPLGIVAHHALNALPQADPTWALHLARRAAQEAQARLAYDAAADLYLRARQALADPGTTCDLLLDEAGCRLRLGAGAEGRQLALEAIALARRSNDGVRLARAALAFGGEFQIGVVSAELLSVLEEAQAALPAPGHQGLRAQLLARQAAAMQPAVDPSVPLQMAHRALALARQTKDADVLQATLYSVCSAFGDYEEPDVRAPLNRELVDLAQQRGDRVLAHRGLTRLAVDLVELGRLADCHQVLLELEALARSAAVPQVQWRVPLVRSMLAGIEGRFDACDALLEEARALGAGLDDWNVRVVCAFHRFALGVVSERPIPPELLTLVRGMVPGDAHAAGVYGLLIEAAVAAREGDAARTRSIVERVPAELGIWTSDPSTTMWFAAPVRLVGAKAPAQALAQTLRRRRLEYSSWGAMGLVWGGPVCALHGLLEAAQGNLAAAERLQGQAVQKLRALEADGFLARELCELARTRLELGNREGALPLLDEALELADSLGQRQLVPQLIALRGGRAEPRAVTAPLPEAAFSLEKQGDTWAVGHAGKTFHLKDSRGLQMLRTLLDHPGQELHALDLSGAHGEGAVDSGDAGELLDDTARARYRARAADLKESLEEAEAHNDRGRAARLRAELEFLEDELSRAFGLSGKARRSASAAERARVNVQRRIKDVLKKIEENDAALGQHLAWAVKTGTFCSYRQIK